MKKIVNIKNLKLLGIIGLIGILSLFCTFYYLNSPFSNVYPWADSSGFLYDGFALTKGLTMYVDFFDHKGPLMFVINALGIIIGGMKGVWILDYISVFIFFFMTYKSIKLFSNNFSFVISAIIMTLMLPYYLNVGNYTESFSLGFLSIGLYFLLKYFYKEQSLKTFDTIIIGASFMCVLLLRPNMVGLWAVFCPMIFFDILHKKEYKRAFKIFISFVLGAFLVFLPFIIYFCMHNAWSDFIYTYITVNFLYINNQNSLISSAVTFLKNPITILVIMSIISLIINKNKNMIKNRWFYLITLILVTLLTFYTVILSGYTFPHYAVILAPICMVWLGHLLDFVSTGINKYKESKQHWVLGILVISLLLVFCYENNAFNYLKTIDYVWLNKIGRLEMDVVKDYLDNNSNKDDKIIVSGNSPEFYIYSGHLANTKYFYQGYPFFMNDDRFMKEFLKDVSSKNTKFFISCRLDFLEFYPDKEKLEKILNEQFKKDLVYDQIAIYKRIK